MPSYLNCTLSLGREPSQSSPSLSSSSLSSRGPTREDDVAAAPDGEVTLEGRVIVAALSVEDDAKAGDGDAGED